MKMCSLLLPSASCASSSLIASQPASLSLLDFVRSSPASENRSALLLPVSCDLFQRSGGARTAYIFSLGSVFSRIAFAAILIGRSGLQYSL